MGTLFTVDGTTGNLTTAGSIKSTSTSDGFTPPKLTTTQRNAISSPTAGLQIFNTTTNQEEFYNGTSWLSVGITQLTGDIAAGPGAGSVSATLATVNASPGTTTISSVTTNAKGLVTSNTSATTTGNGSVVLATSPTLVTPVLGTPTSVTLTNATGLPLTTGVTGVLPVANGGTGVTSSTGTVAVVLSTSPTLVTPLLGTPTSGTLTNCTGLPLTTGVTGTLPIANGGTNSSTALANGKLIASSAGAIVESAITSSTTGSGNVVLATSPTLVTPALGTPASGVATNLTGLPLTTGVTGTLQAANFPALTGDITTSAGSLSTTLATVNSNTGSFGASTAIPNFTVNGKGLITAAGTNVVVAPAGTLTGTTLASNVVSSSLTSLGTQSQALNMGSHLINNVTNPVSAQDAATKNYVDTKNVVQATSTASSNTTSSTPTATALTATITPSNATKQVKITCVIPALETQTAGSPALATILNGSTNLAGTGLSFVEMFANTTLFAATATMVFVDSPATTSPVTYTMAIFNADNTTNVSWNGDNETAVIILEEI